jgi:hypothetical protein
MVLSVVSVGYWERNRKAVNSRIYVDILIRCCEVPYDSKVMATKDAHPRTDKEQLPGHSAIFQGYFAYLPFYFT